MRYFGGDVIPHLLVIIFSPLEGPPLAAFLVLGAVEQGVVALAREFW